MTEYEFDYRNRLVKVTEQAGLGGAATKIVTFQYDAFNRRTGKQLDSDANGTIERREALKLKLIYEEERSSARPQR